MKLHTPTPYWLMKNGYLNTHKPLKKDIKTDVAIIGAGISGALAAYTLSQAGIETVVIEKRHAGFGSTSASTALLQYEIDEPLHKLTDLVGKKRATEGYLSCFQAIDKIEEIMKKEKINADFKKVPSIQYASFKKDMPLLIEEHRVRKEAGIETDILEASFISNQYGMNAPMALHSNQGAQIDAFKFAHGLLNKNIDIYDHEEAIDIITSPKSVTLKTSSGHTVKAKHIIIACGYESLKYLKNNIVSLSTTYAFATKPVNDLWKDEALLWETKSPYIYIRTTEDNRIIVGGRDDEMNNPKKRASVLNKKVNQLKSDFNQLMPHIPIDVDFTWAGTFGSTKDSLGYIGEAPSLSRTFFILGFGGNGILYSVTGAEIIRDKILNKKNPYTDTFAFNR